MDYVLVRGGSKNDFECNVQDYLTRGFTLVGGVVVVNHGVSLEFYQAMLKNTGDEE